MSIQKPNEQRHIDRGMAFLCSFTMFYAFCAAIYFHSSLKEFHHLSVL